MTDIAFAITSSNDDELVYDIAIDLHPGDNDETTFEDYEEARDFFEVYYSDMHR